MLASISDVKLEVPLGADADPLLCATGGRQGNGRHHLASLQWLAGVLAAGAAVFCAACSSSLWPATYFVRVQQVLACLRPWDGLSVQVQTQSSSDGEQQSFRRQLAEAVKGLETIEWLVPPMLQAR